jgi:hypothetical protein
MALSVKLMVAALNIPGLGAAGHLIISMALFVSTVLLIAPETVFKIAEWCSKPVTNLIFPSARLEKPPLSYVMARNYSQRMRLEDAVEEYKNIIQFYPDEVDAYTELLAVAIRLEDDELYQRYAAKFAKRFKREAPSS